MKKVLLFFAIALAAASFVLSALSQTNGSRAKRNQLDGTWELVYGQQIPQGARDIKIISRGHFIFVLTTRRMGSRFIQAVELTF